jgi:hypothetical protein
MQFENRAAVVAASNQSIYKSALIQGLNKGQYNKIMLITGQQCKKLRKDFS